MPRSAAERIHMRLWWLYKAGKFLLIAAAAVIVLGFVVMNLWNALIPEIFGGPKHSFFGRIEKNTGAFVEVKYSF